MASINFTIVPEGYSPVEVDRYIEILQQEYTQAIAWGEEIEAKLEELKKSMRDYGVYFTLDPENQNEVITKVFDELSKTVANVKRDATVEARDLINGATERSKAIVKSAMEKSVELRTQNDAVLKNLKGIADMISAIIEKMAN